jgi:hypothetical protein
MAIGFPQLPTISGCPSSDIARIAADTDRDRMTGIKIGKLSSIGLIDLGTGSVLALDCHYSYDAWDK